MPRIHFEREGVDLRLYGDVRVSVDTGGTTLVDIRGCKVIRIEPPGKFSLDQLARHRISSILPDDVVGHVYFRYADLPLGVVEDVPIVNIPPRARLEIKMPVDPD